MEPISRLDRILGSEEMDYAVKKVINLQSEMQSNSSTPERMGRLTRGMGISSQEERKGQRD